jgi:ribosome-binding protein aMBF1 (putative translation factor)
MDKDVLEYLTGQIKISNTILKQTNETLSLKSNKIANVLEDILDIEKTVDNCILSQDLYNNMNKSY